MKKTIFRGFALLVVAVCAAGSAGAQSTAAFVPEAVRGEQFELSIRNIMRAEENLGEAPSQVRWTDDSA